MTKAPEVVWWDMWGSYFKPARRLFTDLTSALIISTVALCAHVAAADAPDVLVLKATLWSEHTQKPVPFSHQKHSEAYETDCAECHHLYTDGANTWIEGDPVQKCQECHDEPTVKDENKLSPERQKRNLKNAFHNSCRACHMQLKEQDTHRYEKIPTQCEHCHNQ